MEDIIVTTSGLVYAVMVVEELATPDMTGAYNHGVDECPQCGSNNTCVVFHYCPHHLFYCNMWHCIDCGLLYEYRLIGEARHEYFEAAVVDDITETVKQPDSLTDSLVDGINIVPYTHIKE